ncbi:LuxR C-terminal-related transcriptional regulator [Sphingoaurantiacus capsulatus]|uniref:LuxR C-terminal-related transcriptional regulator n=1 Tax=Sphingoaurantiacus capsulatus TaxID=1771310 RepID=A0ABV7X805_9SPHN
MSASVAVASVDDIARAARAFHAEVRRRGSYRIVLTNNIASKRSMSDAAGNSLSQSVFRPTPDEGYRRRPARFGAILPLAQAARYESVPFWVNAAGIHSVHPNPQLSQIDLAAFAGGAFARSAIVVPVHLPFGQIGIGVFAPMDRRCADMSEAFARDADALTILTRRFIATYTLVTRRRHWLPGDCDLTAREIACLRGAATGKTDREIADRIGRSHATVRFHMHNAWAKLDAVTRTQAAFKAGQLGFIGEVG